MKRMMFGIVVGLLLAALLAGACVFTAVCVCAGKERTAHTSDCIIVLGAKVWSSGQMSNALRYRCETALQAWKDGVAQHIIVTGGQGEDEPAAEADVMREYFIQNGVPQANVIAEAASVNTIQNLGNAKGIMSPKGWETAAVVTNDYHVERALWIAQDAGLNACGIAAPSPERISTKLFCRFRESLSWVLYALRRIF